MSFAHLITAPLPPDFQTSLNSEGKTEFQLTYALLVKAWAFLMEDLAAEVKKGKENVQRVFTSLQDVNAAEARLQSCWDKAFSKGEMYPKERQIFVQNGKVIQEVFKAALQHWDECRAVDIREFSENRLHSVAAEWLMVPAFTSKEGVSLLERNTLTSAEIAYLKLTAAEVTPERNCNLDCSSWAIAALKIPGFEQEIRARYLKGDDGKTRSPFSLPDNLGYLEKKGLRQVIGQPRPGDLVIYRKSSIPDHYAVLDSDGKVVSKLLGLSSPKIFRHKIWQTTELQVTDVIFMRYAAAKVHFVCCGCFKERAEPLKRCAACKSVWYCDQKCQSLAWKTHKLVCGTPDLDAERLQGLSGMNPNYPLPRVPEKEEKVCYLKEEGAIREITQGEFQAKMGFTFAERPLGSQSLLLQLYGEKKAETRPHAPQRAIAMERQGEMGHGLVATQDISKGTVLCYYGGEIERVEESKGLSLSHKFKHNSLRTEDGQFLYNNSQFSSLAVCINDGPANCKVTHPEGAVVAMREIKAGDALYLNYGFWHPQKKGTYVLTEEAYQKAKEICQENISGTKFTTPFFSIAWTPYILAQLFLRGDLPEALKEKMVRQIDFNTVVFEENPLMLIPALSLIPADKRKEFAQMLPQLSQYSLILLAKYLYAQKKEAGDIPKLLAMGKLLDQAILLMKGTLNGDLWKTDFENFSKKFATQSHKDKLAALEKLDNSIPAAFAAYVRQVIGSFWPEIRSMQQYHASLKWSNYQ